MVDHVCRDQEPYGVDYLCHAHCFLFDLPSAEKCEVVLVLDVKLV